MMEVFIPLKNKPYIHIVHIVHIGQSILSISIHTYPYCLHFYCNGKTLAILLNLKRAYTVPVIAATALAKSRENTGAAQGKDKLNTVNGGLYIIA